MSPPVHRKPQKAAALGTAVALRRVVTTPVLLLAGLALLLRWLPGTHGMATGPRIGMGILFVTLSVVVFAIANVETFLRKTTRPADYEGGCPVGESCADCGSFNMKPRQACRSCGGPVNGASEAL